MMKIDEGFWVGLVGFTIAAVCVIAIIVVGVRERRRTGQLPPVLRDGHSGTGWFFTLALILICLRTYAIKGFIVRFPLCVIIPAMDVAFFIGFFFVAIWAWSYVFRSTWHWRIGLWIVYHMLFPACFAFLIFSDVVALKGISWVWIPVGFIVIFAAPYFARFAFEEMVSRGQSEPDTSPAPDFRLWRPGDGE